MHARRLRPGHSQHPGSRARGATHINTTVNGLGDRAGNAALEECALALKHLHGIDCGIDVRGIPSISALVEQASGRQVAWQKSVVGAGVFTHEAGIHVDGLLKHRRNYEGLNPDELGRSHSLVLGKHSGAHMVELSYRELGIELQRWQSRALLGCIRRFPRRPSAVLRAPTCRVSTSSCANRAWPGRRCRMSLYRECRDDVRCVFQRDPRRWRC